MMLFAKKTLKGMVASVVALSALTVFNPHNAMASDNKYRWKVTADGASKDNHQGKAIRRWAELIKEKSDGRMKVNVFYQGELGGQQELFDQTIKGNVEMLLIWPSTDYDSRIGLTYMPYLVLNWEDALNAYSTKKNGWITKLAGNVYSDIGLKYFGPFPEGFGGIATRGKYATNIADARGVKVRSQQAFPLPQTVKAMGYQAIPLDWNEVYTSIQTGVVDGDSSNVIYWDYEYFGDLLDYYVHTNHVFSNGAVLMSGKVWDELDEEDRNIVESAAAEVIEQQFKDAKTEDDKWIAQAQKDGMKYIVPSQQEMAAYIKAVREQVWPEAEQALGKEIMNVVRQNASSLK